jgi:polyisoprenoid-binding protein YceI
MAGVLVMALPALGAQYDIDPAHSAIGFRIRHLAISNVKGVFTDFAGTFTFDAAAPAGAAVEAIIQTASISTGNAQRDEHLLGTDFFDAVKFPTIIFKSTGLTMSTASEGVLTGTLTMHGVTRDVTLAVEFNGAATDPWGNDRVGFAATGTLNRQDFGLTYGTVMEGGGLVIGNDVGFALEVEGTRKK